MATIEERNGFLFVAESVNDYDKPLVRTLFYPTGVCAVLYSHFIGKRCEYNGIGSGSYRLYDYDASIALDNGGDTKPDPRYTEEVPYNKPRGKWTYERGAWRKPNGETY